MTYQRTKQGNLRTPKFTLPAHWASALINDDRSGMSDEEEIALTHWLEANPEVGGCIGCSSEPVSRVYHDAMDVLACDCLVYAFPLLERLATVERRREKKLRVRWGKPGAFSAWNYTVKFEKTESTPFSCKTKAYSHARKLGASKVEMINVP